MFSKSAQKITISMLLACTMLACLLAGCGKGQSEPGESVPYSAGGSDTAAPTGSSSAGGTLETANLLAHVSDILDGSFVARPTGITDVEGGQTTETALKDDTADITVTFGHECLLPSHPVFATQKEQSAGLAGHHDGGRKRGAVLLWHSGQCEDTAGGNSGKDRIQTVAVCQ